MYAVGPIARKAERLIEVTYEAMMRGIAAVKPGATTGDIGHAIQSFVEPQGMSVVRDFCGHGLGRMFHDEPNIIHIGRPGEGVMLKPGMFFTIEPMINLGKPHVKILSDGWTAVTRDRSLSAQFEHSVGVTATGVEIFTLSQRHGEKPWAGACSRLSRPCESRDPSVSAIALIAAPRLFLGAQWLTAFVTTNNDGYRSCFRRDDSLRVARSYAPQTFTDSNFQTALRRHGFAISPRVSREVCQEPPAF